MVHCLMDPWRKAFTAERSRRSWETIGIVPFTQKPLWDFLEDEAKKAPKPTGADVSAGMDNLLAHLKVMSGEGAVAAEPAVELKGKILSLIHI